MSLVKKIEKDGMVGKIYKVKEGYYYFKIYKNNHQIAQMFYYAFTLDKAESELMHAFDLIDEYRMEKL